MITLVIAIIIIIIAVIIKWIHEIQRSTPQKKLR